MGCLLKIYEYIDFGKKGTLCSLLNYWCLTVTISKVFFQCITAAVSCVLSGLANLQNTRLKYCVNARERPDVTDSTKGLLNRLKCGICITVLHNSMFICILSFTLVFDDSGGVFFLQITSDHLVRSYEKKQTKIPDKKTTPLDSSLSQQNHVIFFLTNFTSFSFLICDLH